MSKTNNTTILKLKLDRLVDNLYWLEINDVINMEIEIEFKNILDIDRDTQLKIRNWRNHDDVRKYLFNSNLITEEEHFNWLTSLKNNDKNLYFIAYKKNTSIGVVNATKIDNINKSCDVGIYLNPDYFFKGLGSYIYRLFIEYIFNNLNVENIKCEVLGENIASLKLHRKVGFVEDIKRKEIIHDNKTTNVHLFEISKAITS